MDIVVEYERCRRIDIRVEREDSWIEIKDNGDWGIDEEEGCGIKYVEKRIDEFKWIL
jgi:signal transduction histidine kinase